MPFKSDSENLIFSCRKCGAPFEEKSINRRLQIINCAHCDAIYDLLHINKKTQHRAPASTPGGFICNITPGNLSIRFRNPAKQEGSMLPIAVVLAIGALFILSPLTEGDHKISIEGIVLLSPFLIMLTYSIYREWCGKSNQSTILVDSHKISTIHSCKLVTLFPPVVAKNSDVNQIFVSYQKIIEEHGPDSSQVRYVDRFDVLADLKSGASVILMKDLRDIKHALFIEEKIELFLSIRDQEVAGEYIPEHIRDKYRF